MTIIRSKGRSGFEQPLPPHRRQHIHGRIQPMASRRVLGTGAVAIRAALLAAILAATGFLWEAGAFQHHSDATPAPRSETMFR